MTSRCLVALALVAGILAVAGAASADPVSTATAEYHYAQRVAAYQASHAPPVPGLPAVPELPAVPAVPPLPDLRHLPTPEQLVQSVPDPGAVVAGLPVPSLPTLPALPPLPGVPDAPSLVAYEYNYAWHVASYQLSRL